jgi:hypothetical protein
MLVKQFRHYIPPSGQDGLHELSPPFEPADRICPAISNRLLNFDPRLLPIRGSFRSAPSANPRLFPIRAFANPRLFPIRAFANPWFYPHTITEHSASRNT